MKIFTVYDVKAEAYLQPYFSVTTATAVRAFQAAANNTEHDFHRFAEDYTLFEIGTWDEATGDIVQFKAMIPLGTALQHIVPAHLVPDRTTQMMEEDGAPGWGKEGSK